MINPRTSVAPRTASLRSAPLASREAGAGSWGSRQRLRSGAAALHPDPRRGPVAHQPQLLEELGTTKEVLVLPGFP